MTWFRASVFKSVTFSDSLTDLGKNFPGSIKKQERSKVNSASADGYTMLKVSLIWARSGETAADIVPTVKMITIAEPRFCGGMRISEMIMTPVNCAAIPKTMLTKNKL